MQLILAGAREHITLPDLVDSALHALACLAGRDSTMQYHMGQMSVVGFMEKAFELHRLSGGVVTHACQLITNLALHPEVRALMVKSGIVTEVSPPLHRTAVLRVRVVPERDVASCRCP